jgi:hypothetical protein
VDARDKRAHDGQEENSISSERALVAANLVQMPSTPTAIVAEPQQTHAIQLASSRAVDNPLFLKDSRESALAFAERR